MIEAKPLITMRHLDQPTTKLPSDALLLRQSLNLWAGNLLNGWIVAVGADTARLI